MKVAISTLVILIIALFSYVQFSGIRDIKDPGLANTVRTHLLDEHREHATTRLNQSLEQAAIGNLINNAADLLTTRISVLKMEKSQIIASGNNASNVIVHVIYFLENTSETAQKYEAYLKLSQTASQDWIYHHRSTAVDFYLNFVGFE